MTPNALLVQINDRFNSILESPTPRSTEREYDKFLAWASRDPQRSAAVLERLTTFVWGMVDLCSDDLTMIFCPHDPMPYGGDVALGLMLACKSHGCEIQHYLSELHTGLDQHRCSRADTPLGAAAVLTISAMIRIGARLDLR